MIPSRFATLLTNLESKAKDQQCNLEFQGGRRRRGRRIPKTRQLTVCRPVKRYQWRAHIPSEHATNGNAVFARKILENDISRDELRQDIHNHGYSNNTIATPVISATWDLLRALNRARVMYEDGRTGVLILCIDTTMLEMGSIVPCNTLRYNLGLDQDWLFDTESPIWQRVPESAVLTSVTFHQLRTSSFAAMFPACFVTPTGGHKRGLAEIRSELCSADHDEVSCNPHTLVRVILEDLSLSADDIICDQFAVMLYGWKLGHSGPKTLPTLDEKILVGCKDFIKEIQHRLYCASVSKRLTRQTERLTDALNKDAIILEETVKKIQSENLDTFETWTARRTATQDRLLAEGKYDEPSVYAFLTYCRMVHTES
jgi:hypothetical protein